MLILLKCNKEKKFGVSIVQLNFCQLINKYRLQNNWVVARQSTSGLLIEDKNQTKKIVTWRHTLGKIITHHKSAMNFEKLR